ncbi:unnamed protein product [Schistosoma curassoni]|uniref:FAR1 domain-containing protein n=1 Tax=Schistosoma curassoni TaxID=6186 RepID=A0A183KHT6_9TREM|nr:unnamed protein product [Schistosoma curassoni]
MRDSHLDRDQNSYMKFVCWRNDRRRSGGSSQRIRRRRASMNTQCPAFIFCKLMEGYWTVVRGNVRHNHECNPLRYDGNSWVRRLTEAEIETVRLLLISDTAAFDIKHFAYHSYGKRLNDRDIFNMRYKVFSHSNLPGWESHGSRIIKASFKTKKEGITMSVIQCYAPTADSNDDNKDQFYERLQSIIANCPRNDLTILVGDPNAKVGMDNNGYEDIMRRHGLTGRKEREWGMICESMCIQQIGYRWHNISTQAYTQSYMYLTGPHHTEPDRSHFRP